MNYSIENRPLATIEIIEAYEWYESQKEGLGLEFLNEIEVFYSVLRDNPLTFSYYQDTVRQGRIARFPYLVVYEIFGSVIIVYSVFMEKQDPVKKRIE